ncbi:DUF2155 domain-containing protein [Hyphococcus lacteus]|uniref:DUF2155 domain-containing protein n=1 Tax=Hyphococcus lacteus TaxID=3143536 RepID=A0ABV3Z460_9PROT
MLKRTAVAILGLMVVPAFAQEAEDDLSDLLDVLGEGENLEEESELDALSRNQDDPFSGVIDAEEREPLSVTLRALNKITARYIDIEIKMNEIARFGSLELQPRTCDKRPPEEIPETTAFLEIFDREYNNRQSDLKILEPEIIQDEIETTELEVLPGKPVGEQPLTTEPQEAVGPLPIVSEGPQAEGINIFRGWMFASSPALNALEHPVYDVWVIDCKTKLVEN